MMRRFLFILTFIVVIIFLLGCSKLISYKLQTVSCQSIFDETTISFDLIVYDLEDAENSFNYFLSEKSLSDFYETLKDNDYFYNYEADVLRFFKEDNYFILQYVREEDNTNLYKLKSEFSPLIQEIDQIRFAIPFMTKYGELLNVDTIITDNEIWEEFLSYYENISYATILTDEIVINDRSNLYCSSEIYKIHIIRESGTISFTTEMIVND